MIPNHLSRVLLTTQIGIRSCPGQDLVIAELYTLIGGLVWAFDIKRPEGLRGYQNPLPVSKLKRERETSGVSPGLELLSSYLRHADPSARGS